MSEPPKRRSNRDVYGGIQYAVYSHVDGPAGINPMMKLLAFAVIAALSAPATAQAMPMAMPVCPRDAEQLPIALAGWANKSPLTAAHDNAAAAGAVIALGVGVDVTLAATPAVSYIVLSSHPGDATSHGGMLSLTITTAGVYRVALGSAAWVDLVKDKTSLNAVAHSRGPACSGIRKMVDFAVQPGSYILQIIGNHEPRISVLVAKLP